MNIYVFICYIETFIFSVSYMLYIFIMVYIHTKIFKFHILTSISCISLNIINNVKTPYLTPYSINGAWTIELPDAV